MLDYAACDLQLAVNEALRNPCPYCFSTMTASTWSCDHVIPISRGGPHALENVEIICRACNEAKGDLTRDEFYALMEVVNAWPLVARRSVKSRLRTGGKYHR